MELIVNPAYVLSFLTKGVLYSRLHDVFIREIVQNSLDSISHRRALNKCKDYKGKIIVSYESATLTKSAVIKIKDNGFGLSRGSIETELLTPMTPYSKSYRSYDPRLKEVQGDFIGRYGMGLMTPFHVSDTIIMRTYQEGSQEGHQVIIHLVWNQSGAADEFEPEKLEVTHSVLKKSKENNGETEVEIRLNSVNPTSQERIKLLRPDTVWMALKYYFRHIDPQVELTFEHKGHIRTIDNEPYIGEMSRLSYFSKSKYMTICLGPRTDEPNYVGLALCIRGVLVSLDHPKLIDDLGQTLVGEIDILDTRLINLKPSREEAIEDVKFRAIQQQLQEAKRKFDDNYRSLKKGGAVEFTKILKPIHPLLGVINEEDDGLQSYLKIYFFERHEYISDLILQKVLIRVESPVGSERKSIEDIVKYCKSYNCDTVYFFYEESYLVDHLCYVSKTSIWWRGARRYDAAVEFLQGSGVVLKLRHDITRYSIEPLLRHYFENIGYKFEQFPSSYKRLSQFMKAEPINIPEVTFPISLIHAGGNGKLVYPHPDGIWLNADIQFKIKPQSKQQFDILLKKIVLSFLGFKFEELEKILYEFLE